MLKKSTPKSSNGLLDSIYSQYRHDVRQGMTVSSRDVRQ